jgi:hypothetical protein
MLSFRLSLALLFVIATATLAASGVATGWLTGAAIGGAVALMQGLWQRRRRV